MIFHSLRWRLQAWHGLILVLVLAAFGYTAWRVASDDQLRRIDQDLEHRLGGLFFRPQLPPPPERERDTPRGPPPDEFRKGHRMDFVEIVQRLAQTIQQAGALDSSQTNGFYYALWQNGALLAKSPNAPADLEEPKPDQAGMDLFKAGSPLTNAPPQGPQPPPEPRMRGNVREMFRFFPHGECLLVGHLMAPEYSAMSRLAIMLFLAGTSVLLLGLAGGWWVSTRAIRPIGDISATATKIAAGDLSQRITAAGTASELGQLVTVLNSTFARLEAAFANQARFTADASHELRTPVSVILSQTQSVLSRERSSPEYREALEACQRAAQRMRHLTESLLQLARLDAGQEHLQHSKFDLAAVTGECVQLLRPLAAERKIELICDLAPAHCVGDAQRVAQVATNLLTNAIHFNHDGGEVRVKAFTQNGSSLLTVSDSGQGIPNDDLGHIFERFYRVDKSRSRAQGRNGLGLAISKAIVDAHGGTLEVASTVGTGSTFTVKLPSGPA